MFSYITFISGLFVLQIASAASTFKKTSSSIQVLRSSVEPECRGKEPGRLVKDPYACEKFYYCGSDGSALVVDCPHGMIFNDEKEICDFPSNYECIPRVNQEEVLVTTSEISQSTLMTKITTTQNGSSSWKPTFPESKFTQTTKTTIIAMSVSESTTVREVETICPRIDTEQLIFLGHPYDCHRYFICYHGVPVAQECISELHWNRHSNRCDFPENSDCLVVHSTSLPPSTAAASILKCPLRGQQIYPHPNNCNYFIYCINGYATVQQCPFYHHFDVLLRKCLWQTVAKCMPSQK